MEGEKKKGAKLDLFGKNQFQSWDVGSNYKCEKLLG